MLHINRRHHLPVDQLIQTLSVPPARPAKTGLDWFVRAGIFLTGSFFVMTLTILVSMRVGYPAPYPDAFASYEALMPGNAAAPLRSCVFQMQSDSPESLVEICKLDFDKEMFAWATAMVMDGKIQQLRFYGTRLLVGDLVRLWGRPDHTNRVNNTVLMRWDEGMLLQAHQSHAWCHSSYHLPVETVLMFERETIFGTNE